MKFKNIFIFTSFVFLVSCSTIQSIQEKPDYTTGCKYIFPGHPSLYSLGRFDTTNPEVTYMGYSSSSVSIHFQGRGIKAKLVDEQTFGNFPTRFLILVDGKPHKTLTLSPGERIYTLVEFEKVEEHTVTLYKETEAYFAYTGFKGFILDNTSRVLKAPKGKKRKIEFIGDSITCGYGVLGKSGNEMFRTGTESSYNAYAQRTARKLDAEAVTICKSGIGVVQNFLGSRNATMPIVYPFIEPIRRKPWINNGWEPQIIVINLGTNDISFEKHPTEKEFVEKYIDLIRQVRENYPNKPIIICYGPMFEDVEGFPKIGTRAARPWSIIRQYTEAVQEETKRLSIRNIYRKELTNIMVKEGFGSNWHPNVNQAEYNAEELAEYIRKIMNW